MENKFLQPGEQRAAGVEDLFAIVAPRYDLINDLQSLGLHRCWKRTLIKMAGIRPGERALDVCCGTGDVALALHRSGAEVTAVDFSPAMLAIAQERARNSGCGVMGGEPAPRVPGSAPSLNPPTDVSDEGVADHTRGSQNDIKLARRAGGVCSPKTSLWSSLFSKRPHHQNAPSPVQFLQGDALRLPFPDETFDVVTVAYGLRNLADWERGLDEMWRVARPGARLLVLDFGKPDHPFWRGMYFDYLKFVVPWFGKIFYKDAATHAYIFASLQAYPAQQGVADKMKALHCADVRVRNLMGGAMSVNFGRKQEGREAPLTNQGAVILPIC